MENGFRMFNSSLGQAVNYCAALSRKIADTVQKNPDGGVKGHNCIFGCVDCEIELRHYNHFEVHISEKVLILCSYIDIQIGYYTSENSR